MPDRPSRPHGSAPRRRAAGAEPAVDAPSGDGAASDAGTRGARTRTTLLDTAERLFAEHGFAATSLRRITAAAGANLAAVHYHFGSKQELFLALFRRRIEPINRARLASLERLVDDAAPDAPQLEDVLDALVRPVLDLHRDADGAAFARLVARLIAEPNEHLSAIHGEFEEVRARFFPVIATHAPHLGPQQLAVRMHFTIGSMANVLAQAHRLEDLPCMQGPAPSIERVADELVAYAAAGLRAPAPRATPRPAPESRS